MYELACPTCNSPSQYDFADYLLMCPFCSTTFRLDLDNGQKEVFTDHYIVSNSASPGKVKDLVIEWLKRLNHKPSQTDREYFVTNIKGLSIPFWVVSMEAHTVWKGLVKRQNRTRLDTTPGSEYLIEQGQFRRNYRWAISSRTNLCEFWGMTRLHEPKEKIRVEWDGFPLDSTFSRGQIWENEDDRERTTYDSREFFEFKFANGLPILGVQINEDEALRRAHMHVGQYHLELSRLNVDYLIDYRTEIEIAGIQLIHLPFWYAQYVYRPRTALRHFVKPKEKNVIIDGYNNGILKGELAVGQKDKLWVNAVVCAVTAIFFLLLGSSWHPAFFFVSAFALIIAIGSGYVATVRASKAAEHELGGQVIEAAASSPRVA